MTNLEKLNSVLQTLNEESVKIFKFSGSPSGHPTDNVENFPTEVGTYETPVGNLSDFALGSDIVNENGKKWVKIYENYSGGNALVESTYTAIYVLQIRKESHMRD